MAAIFRPQCVNRWCVDLKYSRIAAAPHEISSNAVHSQYILVSFGKIGGVGVGGWGVGVGGWGVGGGVGGGGWGGGGIGVFCEFEFWL